ncbi:hypothetical protein Athai_46050 [Actinocatenispora thailandica]|uniref:Uncharacterized protein n=1 Tax=Actinocatenispora thailandica TaxID=227318 RepID=A0A7R7HYA2_9ACTN|nr:hypothetical protein Athai_46050 [Actinocatenispora thailandica]
MSTSPAAAKNPLPRCAPPDHTCTVDRRPISSATPDRTAIPAAYEPPPPLANRTRRAGRGRRLRGGWVESDETKAGTT